MTPVHCGPATGALLGPIAVATSSQKTAIGSALITYAVDWSEARGDSFVILVGDQAYYGRFGFKPAPAGTIKLPGPVDPARVLIRPASTGAVDRPIGEIRPTT